MPGYTVAGKTGTAQIPTAGHDSYVPGAYMASFVGYAPAVNPTLSMIVVLDRPTPIFGGTVAAPVFSQIMSYALHRYDIPTTPGAQAPATTASGDVDADADAGPGPGHHVTLPDTPIAVVSQGCPGHATLSGRPCHVCP